MHKSVQKKIDKERFLDAKKAATVAFNHVLKSNYEWPVTTDYEGHTHENIFHVVPSEFVYLLLSKRLAQTYPKKHKYIEVQNKFNEQFPRFQESTAYYAQQQLKSNRWTLVGIGVFVLIILGWAGYKLYQQHQESVYWQNLNSQTTYSGSGYKITFPCSDVHNSTLLNDADFNTTQDLCMFYGGDDHKSIDMYTVQISRYLSNKYNPYEDLDCSDYTDNDTGIQYHAIYNEKRNINGVNIYICGWDSKLVDAKILNGNTVYTLSVTPSDPTTTYKKLNNFLSTFQFQ